MGRGTLRPGTHHRGAAGAELVPGHHPRGGLGVDAAAGVHRRLPPRALHRPGPRCGGRRGRGAQGDGPAFDRLGRVVAALPGPWGPGPADLRPPRGHRRWRDPHRTVLPGALSRGNQHCPG
ncbi:hypothetical protein ACFFX0_25880 [Citricoccus parietis]|uniref:Uncharacterized protein n=1 Tax=Citricoccus parietis TaxID=592307 RepID=A0ABV5G660_9MICC